MRPKRKALNMFHYGLTGGIGTGKSTLGKMFAEMGVPVVDADSVGKKLLAPGAELTREVARRFPACLKGQDAIDRTELAKLIFADSHARMQLEDLLHPAIWDAYLACVKKASRSNPAFAVLEAAVILESRTRFKLSGIILVVADKRIRMQRLLKRGDLDQAQIIARMEAQSADHEKLVSADYVIENNASLDSVRQQVDLVMRVLNREVGKLL